MKTFYIKTLVFQTIVYFLLWATPYLDKNALTEVGKKSWGTSVIMFYIISVIITFIIPMTKEIIEERNKIPNNYEKKKRIFKKV
jgi:hypothetical protein